MPRDPFATPVGALEVLRSERVLAMAPEAVGPFLTRLQAAAGLGLAFDSEDVPRARPLDVRGGVAVIPMRGPIVPRGSMFSAFLGLASIEGMRELFRAALAREDVRAVLFDVDSPGGRVAGVADFADEIRAARGTKPILAVANEYAFSAAYFLASAADHVFVTQSGAVGSIGVVAMHVDESAWLANEGVRVTLVTSGAKKALFDSSQPLSEAGRAELERIVAFHAEQFFGGVAASRPLGVEAVRGLEAGTFDGQLAVRAKLADRVGTFDDALARAARLGGGRSASRNKGVSAMTEEEKIVDLEAKRQAAEAKAAEAEQKRVEAEAKANADLEAGKAESKRRASEINDLCMLAGCPERAGDLIAGDDPVDTIRAALAAERKKKADPTSTAHGAPAGGARAFKRNSNELFTKRAEELREARAGHSIISRIHARA